MKRSSSGSSHTPELSLNTKPHISSDTDPISDADDYSPTTPAKKKAKAGNKAATPKKEKAEKVITPKKDRSDAGQGNGEWTPDVREAFMDLVIATGYKAMSLEQAAADVRVFLIPNVLCRGMHCSS
jgi:hypothetical protein